MASPSSSPIDPLKSDRIFNQGAPDPFKKTNAPPTPQPIVPNATAATVVGGVQVGQTPFATGAANTLTPTYTPSNAANVNPIFPGSQPATGGAIAQNPLAAPSAAPTPNVQPAQPIVPPSNPVESPQAAKEYLDSLTAVQHVSGNKFFTSGFLAKFSMKTLALIGGGIVAIIAIIILFAAAGNRGGDPTVANQNELGARLKNLQTIIKYGQDNKGNIANQQTINTIAEAKLAVDSRLRDLSAVYGADSSIAKPPNPPPANTDLTATTETLNTARSTNTLDAAFVTALSSELTNTNAVIKNLYSATTNDEKKAALDKTYIDFAALLSRISPQN
jgi:hypothetical protein